MFWVLGYKLSDAHDLLLVTISALVQSNLVHFLSVSVDFGLGESARHELRNVNRVDSLSICHV